MRWLRSGGSWMVLLFSAVEAGPTRGDVGGKDASPERVASLIQQLGDPRFARREAASKELVAIGERALPAVRRAAATAENRDVRRRAAQIDIDILMGCRKTKSIGLEFAVVKAGEYQMGSPRFESGRRTDEAQHQVRITRSFLLGAYEVTQDEYRRVMKASPSWFAATGPGKEKVAGTDTDRFPVERVTWFDAVEFCNRMSKLDGFEPYYKIADVERKDDAIVGATVTIVGGNGYRLPTEAEWEFGCRAYSVTAFFFGSENTGREANLRPGPAVGYGAAPNWPTLDRTAKVGTYKPNPLGLHDMHGNVAEWCWDWYDRLYYSNSPVDDPPGPEKGTHRVVRGGSWLVSERNCRSASRFPLTPEAKDYYTGFRIARTP